MRKLHFLQYVIYWHIAPYIYIFVCTCAFSRTDLSSRLVALM